MDIYVVIGYEEDGGCDVRQDFGEVVGVCLTSESAESLASEARLQSCWGRDRRFFEVEVTRWSGDGPRLAPIPSTC